MVVFGATSVVSYYANVPDVANVPSVAGVPAIANTPAVNSLLFLALLLLIVEMHVFMVYGAKYIERM
jgi:hypothetical protein